MPFLAWTWVPHLKCKSIYNRCHDVSDKGCSLSLYVHTWLQCVWNITFPSTTSDSFFSNPCSIAIQFQISLSPCELPHVLELLDMMELQSRSNVHDMYLLCVPASAVSILSLFWDSVHAMKISSSGQKCHHITTSAVSTLWLLYLATFFLQTEVQNAQDHIKGKVWTQLR